MINSFLLIGQSNMSGRGELNDSNQLYNFDVYVFKNNEWVIAKEPYHDDSTGAGLAASFGDSLNKKYKKKIGFIPCAYGGTMLSQWQPGEKLYENAVSSTLAAQKGSVLKGILWHQGENDSVLTLEHALNYENAFYSFLTPLLRDINAEKLPFIIGELAEFLDAKTKCTYWKEVNAALRNIAHNNHQMDFVSSSGLQGRDDVHFDTPSLREFGLRYATVWDFVSKRLNISLD